jgi:hypothetical protein
VLTPEQLDELDRLEKAATNATTWGAQIEAKADLHRASRNALPELLAMARQLLRAREALDNLDKDAYEECIHRRLSVDLERFGVLIFALNGTEP